MSVGIEPSRVDGARPLPALAVVTNRDQGQNEPTGANASADQPVCWPGWLCRRCEKVIRGKRAEHCTGCHETFSSTTPGDMHRVGRFVGGERRCLSVAEIEATGRLVRNRRGYWTRPSRWGSAAQEMAA